MPSPDLELTVGEAGAGAAGTEASAEGAAVANTSNDTIEVFLIAAIVILKCPGEVKSLWAGTLYEAGTSQLTIFLLICNPVKHPAAAVFTHFDASNLTKFALGLE